MRAARIDRPGEIRIVDLPAGEPGPGDVTVEVAYAGICGSDVEVFAGRRPPGFVRYPVVPGHEWSGTVIEAGGAAGAGLLGRKVVGEGFRSCEACGPCRRGEAVLCETAYDEIGFTRPGAWAERMVIPASQLHALDDGADLRSAAGLEPAACAADAVRRARIEPGDRVAVVGAGTIGALAVQLLPAFDPAEIVVVEPARPRAEAALRCGATGAVAPAETAAHTGRFDAVVETAGVRTAAATAVDLVRRGGRVVLAGIPGDSAVLGVLAVVEKRLEIATVFGAPREAWAHAVGAFGAGLLDPGALVTHEVDLSRAAEALDLLSRGDPGVGKVLLRAGAG